MRGVALGVLAAAGLGGGLAWAGRGSHGYGYVNFVLGALVPSVVLALSVAASINWRPARGMTTRASSALLIALALLGPVLLWLGGLFARTSATGPDRQVFVGLVVPCAIFYVLLGGAAVAYLVKTGARRGPSLPFLGAVLLSLGLFPFVIAQALRVSTYSE